MALTAAAMAVGLTARPVPACRPTRPARRRITITEMLTRLGRRRLVPLAADRPLPGEATDPIGAIVAPAPGRG
jgi:hypothetical protein